MTNVERILGSYSIMRNNPEIVVSVINLDVNNEYIDVMLQLNQQISGFENAKLISIEGKKYNTKEDDLLCIKSINKDNFVCRGLLTRLSALEISKPPLYF